MSFCANCGRQRDETARFCAGCGVEFGDQAGAVEDRDVAAAADEPADVTLTDVPPEVTRVEPPTVPPQDPFASWYQGFGSPPPAGYASSGMAPASPFGMAGPVAPPVPPPFPAGPPEGPPSGGRRGLFLAVAVVVVLAAGGGAYALATKLGKHSTATPPVTTSTSAGSPTASATQQVSSPTSASSASSTPSPAPSLVTVASGVSANAAAPQVETMLNHYFHGINTHNYAEYVGTLNPTQAAKESPGEFSSGYSSTTDTNMTLTGLTSNSTGLIATVTFTSHQSASQSIDNSACNAWTLNLYLVPQGNGYAIGPSPAGYRPNYSNC